METTLHCNSCKRDSHHKVAFGRTITFCPHCGSNNLVTASGVFVGPPQWFGEQS